MSKTNAVSIPDEMKIACCAICTLAEKMKDCKSCPFNIGLKKEVQEQNNAFMKFAAGYLANIPNGAK